jgi:murein DD-endopeptidase MepM/ murein hydrolase activator NlpD
MNRRIACKRYKKKHVPDIGKKMAISGFWYLSLVFLLGLTVVFLASHIEKNAARYDTFDEDENVMAFRNCAFTPDAVKTYLAQGEGEDALYPYMQMALDADAHDFSVITSCSDTRMQMLKRRYETLTSRQKEQLSFLADAYAAVYADLKYFPVAQSGTHEQYQVAYENGWLSERTYLYERFHEGCDLMASVNERGLYPVLSVSDGTVEKIGWLTLGGYRIGIRSEHGAYFYYAHLASYAKDYQPGDTVLAGECIGFMGDTGYSEVEGTTGNFDVHLHFGIYIDTPNHTELSINPYYVLQYLEDKKITYDY